MPTGTVGNIKDNIVYIDIGGEKDGICSRDHMCPGK